MKRNIFKIVFSLVLFVSIINNIYATDEGYITVECDKMLAVSPDEITLVVTAKKSVTDFELTFYSSDIAEEVEVVNVLQGANITTNGNSKVVYLIQMASQENKTVYPEGTKLAEVRFKVPSNYLEEDQTDKDFNISVKVKIADNGTNYNYTLTNIVNIKAVIYGDVNEDGVLNMVDCMLIRDYINKNEELTEQALKNADVNCDGKVNNVDIILWLRHYTEWYPNTLPDKPITDYILYGDANEDGEISLDDAVLIKRYAENIQEITEQGLKNADANKDGKVDYIDAILIQRQVAGLETNLPDEPITEYTLYGDVYEDGVLNGKDVTLLRRYLEENEEITAQALKNADINGDDKVDYVDVEIIRQINSNEEIREAKQKPVTNYVIYGDVNEDGKVNGKDYTKLTHYLNKTEDLTTQALKNADVNNDGMLNYVDAYIIQAYAYDVGYEAITSLPVNLDIYEYNKIVYSLINDKAKILNIYTFGNKEDTLTIPNELDGHKVERIEMASSTIEQTIILPDDITIGYMFLSPNYTIITKTRSNSIANYVQNAEANYVVTEEVLDSLLNGLTLDNNNVSNYNDISEIFAEESGIVVYIENLSGEELKSDDKLGTGTVVKIINQDENVLAEKILCFDGEVNGDGEVDFFDVVDLISMVYDTDENYVWNEYVRKAATFGEDIEPDFFSIISLIAYIYE